MKYSIFIFKHWLSVNATTEATFQRNQLTTATSCFRQEKKLIQKLQEFHSLGGFIELRKGKEVLKSFIF